MIDKILLLLAQAPFAPSEIGVPDSSAVGIDGGIQTILGIVFAVIGGASVVYLVIGGIKYVISGGDSAGVKNAKETIIYAVVGLVVALLAFGAVNFLTTQAGNVAQ